MDNLLADKCTSGRKANCRVMSSATRSTPVTNTFGSPSRWRAILMAFRLESLIGLRVIGLAPESWIAFDPDSSTRRDRSRMHGFLRSQEFRECFREPGDNPEVAPPCDVRTGKLHVENYIVRQERESVRRGAGEFYGNLGVRSAFVRSSPPRPLASRHALASTGHIPATRIARPNSFCGPSSDPVTTGAVAPAI